MKERRVEPQGALWHSVQGQHQLPTHRVAPAADPETSVRVLRLDSQVAWSLSCGHEGVAVVSPLVVMKTDLK